MNRTHLDPLDLFAVALLFTGCAELAPETADAPYSPRDEITHVVDYHEWTMPNGTEYRDRNDDGVVDWQAEGEDRGTDGFGIYKEDNDFDGYYDVEYEEGGIACHVTWTKAIHERVPPIGSRFLPTKTYWKPKAKPSDDEPPEAPQPPAKTTS